MDTSCAGGRPNLVAMYLLMPAHFLALHNNDSKNKPFPSASELMFAQLANSVSPFQSALFAKDSSRLVSQRSTFDTLIGTSLGVLTVPGWSVPGGAAG